MPNEQRHYYKTVDGKSWLNLKTPDFDEDPNYITITEQEWNAHCAELESASEPEQNK